jgi:hypothetical protein
VIIVLAVACCAIGMVTGMALLTAAFFLLAPEQAREACGQVLGGWRHRAAVIAPIRVPVSPARPGPALTAPARKAVER